MMISYFIQWHDIRSDIYLQSYRQPRLGHFMHQKVRDMYKHEHMICHCSNWYLNYMQNNASSNKVQTI